MSPDPTAREDDAPVSDAGATLEILVNGESKRLAAGLSVSELIDHLGLGGRRVAVARNQRVVPRSRYETQRLENGDRFEILEAVGGG